MNLWTEEVDWNSPVPRYAQLQRIIEGHLERDLYNVGDLLPRELQFVQHFFVSRGTVRQALGGLEADGWIARRRGFRTKIIRKPVES